MAEVGKGGAPDAKRGRGGFNFSFSFGTLPASERTSLFRTKNLSPVRLATEHLTQATETTWSVRRETVHDAGGGRTVYRVTGPDGAEQTFDQFHDLPEEARSLLEHAPAFFGNGGAPSSASRAAAAPATALKLADPQREAFVPRDPFARDGRGAGRGLVGLGAAALVGALGLVIWLMVRGRV